MLGSPPWRGKGWVLVKIKDKSIKTKVEAKTLTTFIHSVKSKKGEILKKKVKR
jgi:hypothetical protein